MTSRGNPLGRRRRTGLPLIGTEAVTQRNPGANIAYRRFHRESMCERLNRVRRQLGTQRCSLDWTRCHCNCAAGPLRAGSAGPWDMDPKDNLIAHEREGGSASQGTIWQVFLRRRRGME